MGIHQVNTTGHAYSAVRPYSSAVQMYSAVRLYSAVQKNMRFFHVNGLTAKKHVFIAFCEYYHFTKKAFYMLCFSVMGV